MKSDARQLKLAIKRTPAEIINSGRITRHEHLYLTSLLLADRRMNDGDRLQINRTLEYLQTGRLVFVD
jgi:hypothetical protein